MSAVTTYFTQLYGLLPNVVLEGLIYGIMALGLLITYRILDFPDLTVDGSFPLGAAVVAVLMNRGFNPIITLLAATAAGALAGLCTGIIHVKFKVRDLLSGIITMTGLYSINLTIARKSNLPFSLDRKIPAFIKKPITYASNQTGLKLNLKKTSPTLFKNEWTEALDKSQRIFAYILIVLAIVLVVKILLDLFMRTKAGFLLRAAGDNAAVVTTLRCDHGMVKIMGLMIANALVSLSGGVLAQHQRMFEISNGTGTMVMGLAAVIIGTNLFRRARILKSTTMVLLGSVIYKLCIQAALNFGLETKDMKIVVAVLFLIILILGNTHRKKVRIHA